MSSKDDTDTVCDRQPEYDIFPAPNCWHTYQDFKAHWHVTPHTWARWKKLGMPVFSYGMKEDRVKTERFNAWAENLSGGVTDE